MNLRQLEHVVALAEHRNYHRAAEAIGLTQSALSQSVQRLEDEYGVALFERSRRGVTPTAFGLTMIQAARQTLQQISNLRRELDLMKNLQSGRLIVGCDAWIAESLLGPALARMLGRYPDLRFSVRVRSFEELIDDILAGGTDLYVGPPPETLDARLAWHEVMLPPMTLVCNPDHPLLALPNPRVTDCVAYPIAAPLLPKWYSEWLAQQVSELMTAEGRDITSFFLESDDIGMIRQLIKTTDTVTTLLPSMVADEVSRGLLRTVEIPELDFPVRGVIAHSAQRPLPPAGEILLQEILIEAQSLDPKARAPQPPM